MLKTNKKTLLILKIYVVKCWYKMNDAGRNLFIYQINGYNENANLKKETNYEEKIIHLDPCNHNAYWF